MLPMDASATSISFSPPGSARNRNQHRPSVPDAELNVLIPVYYRRGMRDGDIAEAIKKDVRAAERGLTLGAWTVRRRRKELQLLSVRQQRHNLDTIARHIEEVRDEYGPGGTKRTADWLRLSDIHASEKLVGKYNATFYPEEVARRKSHRFARRNFWSPGVFAYIAVDQHDKWGKYGLWLHLGMETFSGALLWLKIWWTNKNPRLIFSYYLEMARTYGGIPLLTQSDPGSENNGIANGHSMLRQRLDPSLIGTSQHIIKRGHGNIKPEAKWSQFRKELSPSFEDLFRQGVVAGLYEPGTPIDNFVFRRLAIPFMQTRLDDYVRMHNNSKPRADKNKIMPIGFPQDILDHPERHKGARDYRVFVTEDDLGAVEAIYAPPDHPVFELVPPAFAAAFDYHYQAMGSPPVTKATFWDIYRRIRGALLSCPSTEALQTTLAARAEEEMIIENEHIDLCPSYGEVDEDTFPDFGLRMDVDQEVPVPGQLVPEVGDLLRPSLTRQ